MGQGEKKEKISLKRVSELAGVTQSTASRILNQNPKYKYAEETVKLVFDVARENGYRTSQLYRSVFTGKTKSVGVITSIGSFYNEIVGGIHDRLLKDDHAILMGINNRDYDDDLESIEQQIISRLNRQRVDGFILRPTADDASNAHFKDIIDMNVPLITIDRKVKSPFADYVGSDNVSGGKKVAEYLAELGHTNIVHFAGPGSVSSYRERATGLESELIKRGCIIQTISHCSLAEYQEKCKMLFSRENRPTAAFCSNDNFAKVVYEVFRGLGLRIPEDVSVIGYGNQEVCDLLSPKLTSVDQAPHEIGVKAAELFFERSEKMESEKRTPIEVLVDVAIKERESCKRISE
jgi:LacI family transcriptional regulator